MAAVGDEYAAGVVAATGVQERLRFGFQGPLRLGDHFACQRTGTIAVAQGAKLLGQLRASGVTVVMTSHQLTLAERLCTRIALVEQGQLILDGPAAEVIGPDEDLEGLFLRMVGRTPRAGSLSWI